MIPIKRAFCFAKKGATSFHSSGCSSHRIAAIIRQETIEDMAICNHICRHRGSICLLIFASIILTAKENFVSLDKFIIAATTDASELSAIVSDNNVNNTTFDLEQRGGIKRRRHLSPLVSKQSTKFPPLSCSDIFYEDRNKPRPFGDANKGGVYGRYTKTVPSFWISLHDKEYDPTRWDIMVYGYYYENRESDSFTKIIRNDANARRREYQQHHQQQQQQQQHESTKLSQLPPLHVIDVGGNIGWYTLVVVAAAMAEQGYPIIVDVFEPNPRNHRRLCESLFFNEWLRHDQVAVNLYPLGVTSDRMVNQSSSIGGRLDVSNSGTGSLQAMNWINLTETVPVPLISLDLMSEELDWMNNDVKQHNISILKVDVEGFELEVFQGAQQLLQSQTVQNVFFEGNIRNEYERYKFQLIVEVLVECGYVAYKIGGYRGADKLAKATWTVPTLNNDNDNNNTFMADNNITTRLVEYKRQLISECEKGPKKRKREQCNMWWRPI